jgi:hypothetical protein
MNVGDDRDMIISHTPIEFSDVPQLEGDVESHGWWTRVANRKKSKPKV